MDTFVIGFTSLFLPNMSLVFPSVTSGNVRVESYLSTAVAPIGLKPMFSTLFFTLDSCFSKLFSCYFHVIFLCWKMNDIKKLPS